MFQSKTLLLTISFIAFVGFQLLSAQISTEGYVELKDGQSILGPEMVMTSDSLEIKFTNGSIFIKNEHIAFCLPTSYDGCEPPARDEATQDKINAGLVLSAGKWVKRRVLRRVSPEPLRLSQIGNKTNDDRMAWKTRSKLKSKSLVMEYTVSETRAKELCNFAEAFLKAARKHLKLSKGNIGKFKLNVFHDEATFKEVCEGNVNRSSLHDLQTGHDLELFFYDGPLGDLTVEQRLKRRLMDVILLGHAARFRYPNWVRYGLREYFVTAKWDSKSNKFSFDGRQIDFLDDIKRDMDANHIQKLKSLFHESDSGISYDSGDVSELQQPWTSFLVEDLLKNKATASRFLNFVRQLPNAKGLQSFGEFKRAQMGVAVGSLERKLGAKSDKIQERFFKRVKDMPRLKSAQDYVAAGRLALMRGKPRRSEELLNEAVVKGALGVQCMEALGQSLFHNGKFGDAESAFDKAIEQSPLQGALYYWKALSRIAKNKKIDKESLRLLKLAVEMEPGPRLRDAVEFDINNIM